MTGDRAENLGDHKAPRTVSRLRDESDAAGNSGDMAVIAAGGHAPGL